MLSRWFSQPSAGWRVLIALLLSLLLHLVLLGFVHIDLSIIEPRKDIVEVRFANLVRSPKPVQQAVEEAAGAKPQTEAKPEIEERLPEPQTYNAVAVEDTPPLVESSPEALPQDQLAPVALPAENITDSAEGFLSEPERVASEAAEEAPLPLSFVETEFDIVRGINGSKIGQTRIHYQSRDDGSYTIESESEAKGLVSLFVSGKLIQRSEGSVTEAGLRPSSFLYQYGSASKAQRANFDWRNESITLETGKGSQVIPLPGDSQDLVSFMYQFMFIPPLQEMQLNITNGKRLKAYGYSFVGEEDLSTKIGMLRVMHLENINDDGDEKNEIWLAVDYRFLPVKIRKTEKDGSVIEQVMTNIKTDILQ